MVYSLKGGFEIIFIMLLFTCSSVYGFSTQRFVKHQQGAKFWKIEKSEDNK